MSVYRFYAQGNSYEMPTHPVLEEPGIDYQVTRFNVRRPPDLAGCLPA